MLIIYVYRDRDTRASLLRLDHIHIPASTLFTHPLNIKYLLAREESYRESPGYRFAARANAALCTLTLPDFGDLYFLNIF